MQEIIEEQDNFWEQHISLDTPEGKEVFSVQDASRN
jgi:hypothetical protein